MSKHLQKLCALVLVCCAFLGSSTAWGQTNPAAQDLPFSTDFSSMQSTIVLPNGISVWTVAAKTTKADAESSVASGDAIMKVVSTIQTSSSNAYNYNKDGNNRLYIQPTANTTSGNNQIAAAINTTGKTGIKVTYDIELINNQTRSVGVILQYRTGESGNWTTLNSADYNSVDKPAGDISTITATLPTEAENKPIVQLRWATYEYVVTGATGSRDGIALDNLAITDGDASQPPLTASESALNFGSLSLNTNGDVLSYVLTANDLSGSVTVTTSSPFTLSKTETGEFTESIVFTVAELATPQTVYVKVSSIAAGTFAKSIVHSSEGIADVNITLSADVYSPFVQDFNNCTGSSSLTGGWSQYSVTGAQTWACTTFGQQGNGVQMSGFANSANNANSDWLISPKMDFSTFAIPLMSVNYRTKYAGDALKVMVSTDYTGAGNPTAATWTELASLPADDADAWKLLENIGLQGYKSANTYIAFVYTSTTESAARWTLDNFEVKEVNTYLNTSNLNLNFAETAAGSKSAAQEFTFSAGGYTADVVVTAPANFELSKDGTAYSSSLTYTSTEAAATNKVYVRFAPATTALLSTGAVTFTSGTEAAVSRGMLSGSSLLKANTLEVVTWNMEWFGSTGNGPDDEQLQYDNAKKVIQQLDADIIGVQEVVDETKLQQLAAETGYTYTTETMSWQAANEQKVGFLYKTSVVTMKKEKVLLSKLFADIKAGTKDLADYPVGDELFWASGRLPYLVEFQATINGVKQTLHVVNLHAKANGENSTQDYERRKYDAKVLKDSLDAQYGNVNLILLGDFNDDVDKSVIGTNQPSSFDAFVSATTQYTTLTKALSEADKVTYESGSLRSFLDHIFISNELTDEYVPSSIAIEELLLTTIPNFRTNTSDHLPVSARFILTADPVVPANVSFTTASVSKAEDAGKFNVSLTLSEAVATAQTVTVTPASSSTASAADYNITGASNGSVTVTIPANATTATFEVGITDDTETEAAEQVVFELSNPSNGITLGTVKTFTLTIEANDAPTPATVTFTSASVSKAEDAGSVTVSLTLSKAMATAQTVTIAPVAGGTASAADYTLTGATNNALTVTIPANATTATFSVNIIDDTETEGAEQIAFEISNPSSGLVLGTAKTFTLTIEANDAPTGIADGTKGQFSVYPTLVNGGNVRLLLPERVATTAKVSMVVYSAEGRKVLTANGSQTAVQTSLNSQIAKLPAGIYMILIETGKEYFQTKMVKN